MECLPTKCNPIFSKTPVDATLFMTIMPAIDPNIQAK